MVNFHLFDSPVDAQSVIFMYDIVSDMQLGKAMKMLPFEAFVFFLLLFLRSENIAFGDHGKMQCGILIATPYFSVSNHNLPRQKIMVIILRIKAVQLFCRQILCQSLGSGPRSGQKYNLEFIFLVSLQIFDQHFNLVVISTNHSGTEIIGLFKFQMFDL